MVRFSILVTTVTLFATPGLAETMGSRGTGLADCSDLPSYQQPFDPQNFFNLRNSDEDQNVFGHEDIVDGLGVISPLPGQTQLDAVRVWGISMDANNLVHCPDDDLAQTPFLITVSTNIGFQPDTVLDSTQAVPVSIVDTGVPSGQIDGNIFEYTFENLNLDASGGSWIGVQRTSGIPAASGAPCVFRWADETVQGTYDDYSYRFGAGNNDFSDQSICLRLSTPEVVDVPALGPWGGFAFAVLLAGGGALILTASRRRTT